MPETQTMPDLEELVFMPDSTTIIFDLDERNKEEIQKFAGVMEMIFNGKQAICYESQHVAQTKNWAYRWDFSIYNGISLESNHEDLTFTFIQQTWHRPETLTIPMRQSEKSRFAFLRSKKDAGKFIGVYLSCANRTCCENPWLWRNEYILVATETKEGI